MNAEDASKLLDSAEYDFLRTNPNLGNNIILLTFGGSHAYGTNTEGSDVDIRGIATNRREDLLTMQDFEQVVDDGTDTTVYSLEKMIKLLCAGNPNTLEVLGCRPQDYLYLSGAGRKLLDNQHIFLSKRVIQTFGGYANSQLYRMNQLAARKMEQDELERHILRTLEGMQRLFPEKYTSYPEDAIRLYVDKAVNEELDTEIFMDVRLTHYPLRDYCTLWNELQNTVTQYKRVGKRNRNAAEHKKLGKHMMHLVRLYLMCFDILDSGEIVTYRTKEHDWLMDIRNGWYLNEEGRPVPEFYEIVKELESKLEQKAKTTDLPDLPDMERVNRLWAEINETVILEYRESDAGVVA